MLPPSDPCESIFLRNVGMYLHCVIYQKTVILFCNKTWLPNRRKYHFIQIIRYMFRSYDHLQAEIYTSEMNMTCHDLKKIVNNY
jgi:hypothetical protein